MTTYIVLMDFAGRKLCHWVAVEGNLDSLSHFAKLRAPGQGLVIVSDVRQMKVRKAYGDVQSSHLMTLGVLA